MAALAVSPSLALGARATAGPRDPGEPRALDAVSEDFVFPEWLTALRALVAGGGRAGDAAMVAVLRAQDHRADTLERGSGWLGLAAPGVEPFAAGIARDLARLANDRLAVTIRSSRGRLAGLATLAASDPRAVEEAKRARDLGLAGLSIGANRGWRLDHPNVRAILDFAAATGAPVYLPATFAPLAGDIPYRAEGSAGVLAGASSDSADHATQLIFGGLLDATPGLQIVLARLGEATPYWWGRLHELETRVRRTPGGGPPHAVATYFARSLILTSADMTPESRRFCATVLDARRLIRASSFQA